MPRGLDGVLDLFPHETNIAFIANANVTEVTYRQSAINLEDRQKSQKPVSPPPPSTILSIKFG